MSATDYPAAVLETALAANGLPISLTTLINLANGVMAAYDAYSKGTTPSLNGYTYVAPINVHELTGYQLLGFAAYANNLSHNIIILRGTVTAEEADYDLQGWGLNTPCSLPSSGNPKANYGNVKKDLYDFYTGTNFGTVTSLASSFNTAVKKVAQANPGKPWFVAAHSLGGALATLGALDAVVSNSYGSTAKPTLVTFGSLHLGDQSFANKFNSILPSTLRFANLSDFVPSLVSLLPGSPNPYVHVGLEATFIWEKWDNWANHSMQFTYLPTLQNYSSVIKVGPRQYPQ